MDIIYVPKGAFITPEQIQQIIDEVECVYRRAGNISWQGVNWLKALKVRQECVLNCQPVLKTKDTED